ncbi:hypothetical protein M409DRAFT_28854 [Zasmidium cellare ATCC 36951]|uniref:BTB domain-containing protein n=1 Tax=Zasmidium cellare ATCC 36951 TaxID=1080233 RepID=A0A6A6C0Y0_ZASCE|nr:uncharacterized protein M409DRAFT_28854 [Zasmidium cellare ATCC 36951]KAF2160717.1 hypothetical protein M409DRAFT_28854 [Zasmidium cellare ATCC 36951]
METADQVASAFEQPNLVNIKLEDGGTFWVQKPILCSLSSYFRAALQGDFEESRTKTLNLPGCTTNTFKHLLFWMTNRKIAIMDVSPDDTSDAQVQLAHLWAAGEMYLLPKLQNDATDRLLHVFKLSRARAVGISAAFELTSEGSKLRELFLFQLALDSELKADGSSWYTSEEMDLIGAIPGFTKAYVELSVHCPDFQQEIYEVRSPHYKVPE